MSRFESSTVPFHNNVTHKRRAKNPSFSSILLDAIYRSIDEDDDRYDYPHTTPTSPVRSIVKHSECDEEATKQRRDKMRSDSTLETVDLRRAIMIESWMERQQQQRQHPQPPQTLQQQQPQRKHLHLGDVLHQKVRIVRQTSVPATTDFSSSSSSCFTNLAPRSTSREISSSRIFTKTKSRALKLYGELKRSKQQNTTATCTTPVSPGRRFAAFLNSIFRSPSGSPSRNLPPVDTTKLNLPPAITNSTCSSASSFSRSCLSNNNKTTSSSSKSSTPATKRSVRFYPVSVIVDEDSRPCGHKSLHKNNEERASNKLVSPPTVYGGGTAEKQRRWRREKEIDALMMMIKTNCGNIQQRHCHGSSFDDDDDEEMEEEDGGSCASSDLFELENLSSIGVSRYYEELPVYGTTSLNNLTA